MSLRSALRSLAAISLLSLLLASRATASPTGYSLLVTSAKNSSISRFDGQTGAYINTPVLPGSGGLAWTHNLVLGTDGSLYVCSGDGRSILRYNRQTGAFVDIFVPVGSGGWTGRSVSPSDQTAISTSAVMLPTTCSAMTGRPARS